MHWLILLPYYFVGTLALLPLLILICRLTRLELAVNALVGVAIVLSLAGVIVPLAAGWVNVTALTGRPLLVLLLLSFVFAGADLLLVQRLPLPLDDELRDL